jgi:hypothetical protein
MYRLDIAQAVNGVSPKFHCFGDFTASDIHVHGDSRIEAVLTD